MTSPRITALREVWEALEREPGGDRAYRARRAAIDAPVWIYAALRERDAARAVLFECDLASAPRGKTRFWGEGISMHDEREKPAGIFRLVVTLENPVFASVFEVLCADLVDTSANHPDQQSAIGALARRMDAWMAFLRRRAAGLSDEEVLGLFGELLSLNLLAGRVGWTAAVEAWTGPDDGLHDFLGRGVGVEVKTSLGVSSICWISNLDQLDETGLRRLILMHVRLVQDVSGATLAGVAGATRAAIAGESPSSLAEFDRKLLAAGFLELDSARGPEAAFRRLSTSCFDVTATFPRLTRANTPPAISEAKYQLRTTELREHLVSDDEALHVLDQLGGVA